MQSYLHKCEGVPQHFSLDVNFSSGLSDGGQLIAKWVSFPKVQFED
jgi:hypothetical protein